MTPSHIVLLFTSGILVGLLLPLLWKQFNLNFLKDLAEAVRKGLAGLRRLLPRFRRRVALPSAKEFTRVVDPREQQLNDSAQEIRKILLNLASLFQRTGQAANQHTLTLGDVRSHISALDPSLDLKEVYQLLIREIDRMIDSNNSLRQELLEAQQKLEAQRRQIENLKTAIRIDALTQLANRTYLDEKLQEMIGLRKRYQDPFSLLMIDVDEFKPINDTLGHQAGDRILKGLAYKLKVTVRETDFLARFGGDEFALILFKTPLNDAMEVAWKICHSLRESRFFLDGYEFQITLSIGVTEWADGDTKESLIDRADRALYQAKGQGRNRAVGMPPPPLSDTNPEVHHQVVE